MNQRILEVGPGRYPMHHRSEMGKPFPLEDDEAYVGLDIPDQIERNTKSEIWRRVQETYGDRAFFVPEDRADMSAIESNSIDELINLGSHTRYPRVLKKFVKVVAPHGVLRLGVLTNYLPTLMNSWGVRLPKLGFTEIPQEQKEYNYTSRPDVPEATLADTVVT